MKNSFNFHQRFFHAIDLLTDRIMRQISLNGKYSISISTLLSKLGPRILHILDILKCTLYSIGLWFIFVLYYLESVALLLFIKDLEPSLIIGQ